MQVPAHDHNTHRDRLCIFKVMVAPGYTDAAISSSSGETMYILAANDVGITAGWQCEAILKEYGHPVNTEHNVEDKCNCVNLNETSPMFLLVS